MLRIYGRKLLRLETLWTISVKDELKLLSLANLKNENCIKGLD